MYLIILIYYCLFLNVHGNIDNRFVLEYFNYKKVSNIIGFSCNIIEEDLSLFRDFSSLDVKVALSKLTNKSEIYLLQRTNYWKIGIFLDTRCYDKDSITSLLLKASDYRMFDNLYYWMMLGFDLAEVLSFIDDRAFGVSTDFVIAVQHGTAKNYILYDVYNMFKDRGGTLNVTYLGDWNNDIGLTIALKQEKFQRRCNLHQLILKANYFKCAYKTEKDTLEEYLQDYTHATRDARSKFGFHLMAHLSELYNFTLESYETDEWKVGDVIGPVARGLANNSVDFSGSPLTMNIQRTYILKYVHQDWPFRTCFIFRNPQPTNIKVEEILRPFTNEVWCLTALLFALNLIILSALLHFEGIDSSFMKFLNAYTITIGALCQQGTDFKMNQLSTRIGFLFTLIFSLLMYNYYSASVVSARLDEPIFKINDSLVEFGKLQLTMSSEWMAYLEYFLKSSYWETKQFYQNYWLKVTEAEKFMTPEVGIRLVQKGGFAYHTHPDVSYPFIEKLYSNHEICELMEVHLARPSFTAFGVTINSSLVEIARVGLTKISEVGLRQRQITRWQYKKPICHKDILTASSVNIYEFAPHLILLTTGILLSVFMCAIEMFINNYYIQSKLKITASVKNLIKEIKI